jgi:hypothetical protein
MLSDRGPTELRRFLGVESIQKNQRWLPSRVPTNSVCAGTGDYPVPASMGYQNPAIQKPEDLIGEDGLLKRLTKLLVEMALDAEMRSMT